MKISKRLATAIVVLTLHAGPGPFAFAQTTSQPRTDPRVSSQAQAPSEDEIRSRSLVLRTNQHNDDEALEQYERVERHIDRTGGADSRILEDKTYRVIPTGGGTQKLLLKDDGKLIDPAEYARELKIVEDVLQTMADPNDPKAKTAYTKFDKRKRDRAQFVDAASDAYSTKWLDRENWNGHDCDVFDLDPNPNFQAHSMFQEAFAHVKAKIWVDRATNELARGEARVISDVSFGGGILGKLYRGSFVSIEQEEIAPGIWLPTRYQYDFAGRKFLFSFDEHQVVEAARYRRVGAPKEALQVVQAEVSSGKTFNADP